MNEDKESVPEEVQARLRAAAERARGERDQNLERIRAGVRLGCRWCRLSFSTMTEREAHETLRHGRKA